MEDKINKLTLLNNYYNSANQAFKEANELQVKQIETLQLHMSHDGRVDRRNIKSIITDEQIATKRNEGWQLCEIYNKLLDYPKNELTEEEVAELVNPQSLEDVL